MSMVSNIKKGLYGLLFVILATSTTFYIAMQGEDVSMKITQTSSTFYVNESGNLIVAGVENVYLYNGSKKVSSTLKEPLQSEIDSNMITLHRRTHFNAVLIDETYKYDSSRGDVESFPISHEIRVFNGSGYTLQYEVSKLSYDGVSRNAVSPERFGYKMNVEWEDGYSYAKITNGLTNDKIVIKYKIDSNDYSKNVRLFDPTYILNGDSVYVNDSKAYININPHTMTGSGYVNVELKSKQFTGNIDFAIGLNSSDMELWTFEVQRNISNESGNYSMQWVSYNLSSISYDYDGKDRWHYGKDINVIANQSYNARFYLNIAQGSNGKYDVAIKPSAQSFATAIAAGNFYLLDPWWNSTAPIEFINNNITNCSSNNYWNQLNNGSSTARINCITTNLQLNYPYANNLVSYYRFENNTLDENYINSGIVNNSIPSFVNGKLGLSYNHTGLNYINASMPTYLNSSQSQSFCSWINKSYNLSAGSNIDFLGIRKSPDWNLYFTIIEPQGQDLKLIASIFGGAENKLTGPIQPLNTWAFYCAVFNTTHLLYYYNGSLYNSTTYTLGNVAGTNNRFYIGTSPGTLPGSLKNGSIDEVMVFNKSLSASDVSYLYNSGLGRIYNESTNMFYSVMNTTTTNYNSFIMNLTSLDNNSLVRVSSDNGGAWSLWYNMSSNNLTLPLPVLGNQLMFQINLSNGNATYSPTVSSFGITNVISTINVSNMTLQGFQRNITSELGSLINVTINSLSEGTVCADFNHPSYGNSYSCGTNQTSFLINVSWFRKTTLNDSSIVKNVTYTSASNQTFYIQSHQYDEPINLSFNLTGYLSGGSYPSNVKLYVNNTFVSSLGSILSGTSFSLTTFNDSSTSKNSSFSSEATNILGYLNIPKTANLTSNFTANITGFNNSVTLLDYACYGAIGVGGTGDISFGQSFNATSNYTNSVSLSYDYCFTTTTTNVTLGLKNSFAGGYLSSCSLPITGGGPCSESFKSCSVNYSTVKGTTYWIVATYNDGSVGTMNVAGYSSNCYSQGQSQISGFSVNNNDFQFKVVGTDYIFNPWLELGTVDGVKEWNYSGKFNISQNINIEHTSIESYLSSCTADSSGLCNVPIYTYSQTPGIINLKNVSLNYTYGQNPIYVSPNVIQNYLFNNTINYSVIPLKFSSDTNGILQINDIKYDYKGGNKTYNVLAHNSDYTSNLSYNITYYYSDWQYSLPNNTRFIEFIPKTATSKNITPFRQTSTIPIFNITFTNYANPSANLTINLNQTVNCSGGNITYFINTNNTKPLNSLNTSVITYKSNNGYLDNFGLWMWADYSCNSTAYLVKSPKLQIQACANGVDVCQSPI